LLSGLRLMNQSSASENKVFIGLGSNLGDRAGNLLLAVRGMLNTALKFVRLSSIYETEPVGVENQPPFLNMVAEIEAGNLTPEQVLARLLRIEYALGRRRCTAERSAARTVDLDLLLFGNARSDTKFLMLPHPRLHLRRFVLTPLAEIAPDVKHPTLNKTFAELLAEVEDRSRVVRWSPK
jgi:2-amino-4-hydroxy-6-hydroxymethyldihydropteridine diphosphokinase